jgi:hypothetical protein
MMKHLLTWTGALLLAVLPLPADPAPPTPIGPQFQVNEYFAYNQFGPETVMAPSGEFVVTWSQYLSYNGDTSNNSVQAKRYAADGTVAEAEFLVNSYTTDSQLVGSIAMSASGDFVVVWMSYGANNGDPSTWSVQGQRFASNGTPMGAQFLVHTYTSGAQRAPRVAMDSDGDFVVVWYSYGSPADDSSFNSVQGRRFSAAGSPLGPEFQVNTYTTGNQQWPAVAMDAEGNFVVAWTSFGSDNGDASGYSVQAQRFAADGTPQGGNFLVNTFTVDHQGWPAVAMGPEGEALIVWQSQGSGQDDTWGYSVQGQRFGADGTPLGGNFQVNTYTTLDQGNVAAAVGADGRFVVSWDSDNYEPYSFVNVFAKRFSSDGSAYGTEFQVNEVTYGGQLSSSVTMGPRGDFLVVWSSADEPPSDPEGLRLVGQRYMWGLFSDGFESGNTSAWSSEVGGTPRLR